MGKKNLKLQRAIAYHEAAHMVLAWYYDMPVQGISMGRVKGTGPVRHAHPLNNIDVDYDKQDDSPEERMRVEQLVCVLLAGEIVQRQVSRKSMRRYRGRGDRKRVKRLLRKLAGSKKEAKAYRRLLNLRTKELVRKPVIRNAIRILGDTLLQRKAISQKETVDAIIRGMVFYGTPQTILHRIEDVVAQ